MNTHNCSTLAQSKIGTESSFCQTIVFTTKKEQQKQPCFYFVVAMISQPYKFLFTCVKTASEIIVFPVKSL